MRTFQKIMDIIDIKINETWPCDVGVHYPLLFHRVFHQDSLRLGEAYMCMGVGIQTISTPWIFFLKKTFMAILTVMCIST
ncbi:unnamed protein product [Phytomonas sp. Hart1]|nr:unnamed protein product [Phytomonas sp. Hart1]|eukprot:CCW68501.1 unnamed protein product [Phytomonas sp. isolate Hart1]